MKTQFFLAMACFGLGLGASAQAPPASRPVVLSIALEGKPWALQMDGAGFTATFDGTKSDGRRYYFGSNKTSGVVLSVTLEKSNSPATLDDCRRTMKLRLERKENFERKDPASQEIHGMAVVAYTIPEYGGVPVVQRNVFACMPKDDVYIDIHLSKVQYQPSDDSLFSALLETASFGPPLPRQPEPSPEIMKLFAEGSRYFLERNYRKAIGPYQKALDMDKRSHQINKPLWYVLIDNLGMAYGISGNLDKAKEVFDYGILQDADYPLFYYNLACTYAEMNKMELAMEYLEQAFERKANVIPGEKMPDPRTDDSFQRFMKNESFRKLVDSLMAP